MIPLLIKLAIGLGIPQRFAKPAAWIAIALTAAAALWGVYALIHRNGVQAGGAQVTAKVEQQHTARVAEARTDERAAQATTDRIGASVQRADDTTTAILRDQIEELHNAIDHPPVAAAGGPAVIDTSVLTASLDRGIDRANRAAETTDAIP
ncbi:MAG: hypothetical protein M3Y22_10220 [Pseudomonadota bacterium]|nr:hypothetical protein [Pseudomonadota bacterium]